MEHPGISIIVPVFNSFDTLPRCFDSLIDQSFEGFEVILVNDGSTDDSSILCEDIVIRDSRFSYYSKKNGGLSSARNFGMRHAKGEFIAFLDSDDFLEKDFCRVLYDIAKPGNLDILNFGLKYVKDENSEARYSALPKNRIIPRETIVEMISNSSRNKILYFSWSNIYRREFLESNSLIFDERVLLGEDTVFDLSAFMLSTATYSINIPLYNYVYSPNSLTQSKFKVGLMQKFESQFSARMEIHRAWPEISGPAFLQDIAKNYLENSFMMLLGNLRNSPGDRLQLISEMRSSKVFDFCFRYYKNSFAVTFPMMVRIVLFRYRFFRLLLLF